MKKVISYIITLALIVTCLPVHQVKAEENGQYPAYTFEEVMQMYESGAGELVTYEELIEGKTYYSAASGAMNRDNFSVVKTAVEGQTFKSALKVVTTGSSPAAYDAQLTYLMDRSKEIKAGDLLFFGCKIKGIRSETNKDPMYVTANTRIRPDYQTSTNFDIRNYMQADGENGWAQFYGSTVSTVDSSNEKDGAWIFQLAGAQQELEIADVFVINFGQDGTIGKEQMPQDIAEVTNEKSDQNSGGSSGSDSDSDTDNNTDNNTGNDTGNDPDKNPDRGYTFEEVMQLYRDGKGELLTYPGLSDEGAYEIEYQDNINESNFIVKETEVANQDFNKALNVVTTETGLKAWDAQIYFNLDKTKKIEKNDVLFFGCKVRGISSVTNKEAMFVTANTRIRPDRSTSENFDFTSQINADDENDWTQIYGAVNAPADSNDRTDGAWVFQLSSAIQELDIADVFVINFGKEFSKGQFPVMTKSYLGMEEGAQWRQEALERIERIRKADVAVKVVDAQGQPVKDAEIKVEQTRHAFGFGTIVNVDSYSKLDSTAQEKYKEAFRMIAHNRAGFENALKSNYITDVSRQELVEDWMNYFGEQDIDVRGHVLIYGQDSRLNSVNLSGTKTDLENKELLTSDTEEGKAALREWTRNHIQTYVNKYKGRIYNWDVVNENMTSHDWSDRLGGYGAVAEWFKDAHEADPEIKLTYNDYGILSRDSGHQNYHYDLCKYLVDNGAPMTTIGIQGHVSLISPVEIINILDRFSTLGKEIEITEFTYEDDDPELQAQFTRDFMIAVFSEEAVTSLTTWGFWEGCMYQPKAAMFDRNFNLKPNGEVWMDMVYNQWWTNDSGVTGETGTYSTRAFLGKHNVTVTVDGKEYTYPIELNSDGANVIVTLDENETPGIHEHVYSQEWSSDADNHWYSCICGEKTDIGAHIAGEWIIDKEASDTESGSRHRICTVCGMTLETEEIPKTGVTPGNGGEKGPDADNSKEPGADSAKDSGETPDVKNDNKDINRNVNNRSGNPSSANSAKPVKTGDTNNAVLWVLLIGLSGGGILWLKRKSQETFR